jgi:hypothetical protein
MSNRSEEQILSFAPLKVTLGGVVTDVAVLKSGAAARWREAYTLAMGGVPKAMNFEGAISENPEVFSDMLDSVLVKMPQDIIRLFFEYAGDLDKAFYTENAYDEEFAEGLKIVARQAFRPLAGGLVATIEELAESQDEGNTP